MAEPSAEKPTITSDLAVAFCEAVNFYQFWSPGRAAQREWNIEGSFYSMRGICERVLAGGFADELPNAVFVQLISYMHAKHRRLEENLIRDESYATGARCLLTLMDEREDLAKT
jgi:hypothetical protein